LLVGLLLLAGALCNEVKAQTNGPAANYTTNVLAIYLAKTRTNLANVALELTPVLSDHDFASFDTNAQTFRITPDAAKRFGENVCGSHVPFVLVASGQKIYVGDLENRRASEIDIRSPRIVLFKGIVQTDFLIESAAYFPPIPPGATSIRGETDNHTYKEEVRMPDGTTNILKGDCPPDMRTDHRIIEAVNHLFGQDKSMR
jgi:hypothetical protein